MELPDFDTFFGPENVENFYVHGGGCDFVNDDELMDALESVGWTETEPDAEPTPETDIIVPQIADVVTPPEAPLTTTQFPRLTEPELLEIEAAKDEKATKSSTNWGVKRLKGNIQAHFSINIPFICLFSH